MRFTLTPAPRIAHLIGPGRLRGVNGRLVYEPVTGKPSRLDHARLRGVMLHGRITLSDEALRMLLHARIPAVCLSAGAGGGGREASRGPGRVRGRLVPADDPAVRLRGLQHRMQGDVSARLRIARPLVAAKLAAQIEAARHYQRQSAAPAGVLAAALAQLREATQGAGHAADLDHLLAAEGAGARAWFGLLGHLLHPPWRFQARRRRPPTDPVNAMLSLGYTLLIARADAAGQAHGLEPQLGALHAFRAGRPSLACDLVEPLRTPMVDRWVLALCHARGWSPDDFVTTPDTGTRLKPERFADALGSFEQHWHDRGGDKTLDTTLRNWLHHLEKAS